MGGRRVVGRKGGAIPKIEPTIDQEERSVAFLGHEIDANRRHIDL